MTTSLRIPDWLALLLRIVIAVIFIYAGVTKTMAPVRFATDIDNFHLVPWVMAPVLAFYLPWLEILCGVTLLLSPRRRGALLILLSLTFLFVVALTSARVRGIDISCGGFGHAMRDLSFAGHVALNLGILAALLLLLGGELASTARPDYGGSLTHNA